MLVLFVLVLLVIVPAAAALLSETSLLSRGTITPAFGIGAAIVYSRQAISTQPVSGARDIRPSERGEFYYYNLINYLRVTDVLDDGQVIAVARNNMRLCFSPSDSHFRKARLTERFIYRRRFPHFCA
jgi:hypothetical protein